MRIYSLKEADVKGRRVMVRADFDVPLRSGKVADEFRIRETLPTFRWIAAHGGMIRIVTHLGRPEGMSPAKFSLKKIAPLLERLLNKPVTFVADPFDRSALKKYGMDGSVLLFENIRFWAGEERGDSTFAEALARWGDLYVNEAFANSHRAHASMTLLPKLLSSYAGFHLERELRHLGALTERPKRPFVVIVGGAKLETKLPLIMRFLEQADRVLVGGALANALLSLRGIAMGIVPPFTGTLTKEELHTLKTNEKLCVPEDVVAAKSMTGRRSGRITDPEGMDPREYALDIGPATAASFGVHLKRARTVLWNGPLGYAEAATFAAGTRRIAEILSRVKAYKVVGGGDTIGILQKYRLLKGFSHVSTGGGALLQFLSGEKLAGVEALKR